MNTTARKGFLLVIILYIILFLPVVTQAQTTQTTATGCNACNADGTSSTAGTICNPIGSTVCDLPTFIKTILIGIIKIGIPVITLALVYSGFLFVSAQGNPQELEKAKKALLYTLIGAAVLLGSWAIAQLISQTVLAL